MLQSPKLFSVVKTKLQNLRELAMNNEANHMENEDNHGAEDAEHDEIQEMSRILHNEERTEILCDRVRAISQGIPRLQQLLVTISSCCRTSRI